MHKLFIDVNVLLDVALVRKPHFTASQNLLIYIAQKKAHGYCSALTYPILYYLMKTHANHKAAITYLQQALELLSVIELDQKVLERGLQIQLNDYEDSLQAASAEISQSDYLITRNTKDFKKSVVAAVSPVEYLATFL